MNWKVGTFFNVPLYINWSCLLMLAFLLISSNFFSFVFLFAAYFFVILHEYGHCLVAKRFNADVKDITMFIFGGAARIKFSYKNPAEEFWIAWGGPLVNLAFIILLAPFLILFGNHVLIIIPLAVNLMLFLFNLLPIIPMDGGRIFRSVLSWYTNDHEKSTFIAVRFGQIMGLTLSVVAFSYGFIFAGFVLGLIALISQVELNHARNITVVNGLKERVANMLDKPELADADVEDVLLAIGEVKDEDVRSDWKLDEIAEILQNFVDGNALQTPTS